MHLYLTPLQRAAVVVAAAAAAVPPGILDERGELADGPDTLENALLAQEKARRKARDASTKKAKPLWEEDGKVCIELGDGCVAGTICGTCATCQGKCSAVHPYRRMHGAALSECVCVCGGVPTACLRLWVRGWWYCKWVILS
jgi:hypothetical protein